MKNYLLLLPILLSFAAGCTRQEVEPVETETALAQLYEKGKGLRLPDEMVRTLGVETVELAEKLFQHRIEMPARVYQGGRGTVPARATALVGQSDAARLKVDDTVLLQSAVTDSAAATGRLVCVDSQTAALGGLEALIEFPDADGRHAAGTPLVATFVSPERKPAYAVPVAAVQQGSDGAFVYAANGAHFVRTPVKLGAEHDGWREITDGLYAGDMVVARGGDAMWMIELCALKGGTPCCPATRKPARSDD